MNEDLIRQTTRLQQQMDSTIKPEKALIAIDPFLKLPGLAGFWPMSSVGRSTGDAHDLSGLGLHLSYNGNPTYNIYNELMPYIDLDGTGDYLSRPDGAHLDISGIETIFAAAVRGLTMGGWYWIDAIGGTEALLTKDDNAAQRAYRMYKSATEQVVFGISNTGIASVQVSSPAASLAAGSWHCCIGRFIPSTSLSIFVNNVRTDNLVGVPASIFNSTAPLNVGGFNGALLLDGRASLQFLCANALDDSLIGAIFQQTRVLFGV